MDQKKCNNCCETRPLTEFRLIYSRKRDRYWRSAYCKLCDTGVSRRLMAKRHEEAKSGDVEALAAKMIADAKGRAVANGWLFDLDVEWLVEKLKLGRCEVTGIEFSFLDKGDGQKTHPWRPSLDRVDSQGCYTKNNVQVVVWMYNQAKNEWTKDQLMTLAKALAKPLIKEAVTRGRLRLAN